MSISIKVLSVSQEYVLSILHPSSYTNEHMPHTELATGISRELKYFLPLNINPAGELKHVQIKKIEENKGKSTRP